jgi:hypothetical protein
MAPDTRRLGLPSPRQILSHGLELDSFDVRHYAASPPRKEPLFVAYVRCKTIKGKTYRYRSCTSPLRIFFRDLSQAACVV